jgi:hypothetical protein
MPTPHNLNRALSLVNFWIPGAWLLTTSYTEHILRSILSSLPYYLLLVPFTPIFSLPQEAMKLKLWNTILYSPTTKLKFDSCHDFQLCSLPDGEPSTEWCAQFRPTWGGWLVGWVGGWVASYMHCHGSLMHGKCCRLSAREKFRPIWWYWYVIILILL